MPQINLLPWREELRKRRQKEFGITAIISVLMMVGVILGVHLYFQGRIDFQKKRNAFLETEITKLDEQITEIKNLKKEKQRLIARTQKIQQLQSGRPDVVHMVDELVMTLPKGVYYTDIVQQGTRLTLKGVAQSNARVSSLMRQLDGSPWLENPALVEIKADEKGASVPSDAIRSSKFTLGISQTKREKPDEPEG